MTLIRNGGFELGNVDFWEIQSAGTLEIDGTEANRGTYCGKLTSSGAGIESISNRDYISVHPFEVLLVSAYVKSAAARSCKLYIQEFDAELNEVAYTNIATITVGAAYAKIGAELVVNPESVYAQIRIAIQGSGVDEIFYIDDAQTLRYNTDGLVFFETEIADLDAIASSGNTSSDKRDLKGFTTFIADLHVTSAAGTNQTLDVTVVELDGHDNPVVVGTFTQKVAAGSERISLTTVTGKQMYIAYTLGGTTPVFYFEVALTGKR